MILSKLDFIEEKNDKNYWEIKDLNFGMFNLIVGLNATGKTRLINVISNLAKLLSQKASKNVSWRGEWRLEFIKKENIKFKYYLSIDKGKILYEEIKEGRRILLKRKSDEGQIYSVTKKKKLTINPPHNELVINVRRDIKEFPFLEDIFEWANSFLGYKFTGARPDELTVPMNTDQKDILENLGATPILLKKALEEDDDIIYSIIDDFSSIGYNITEVNVKSTIFPGIPNPALLTIVKENDLNCVTEQTKMSQGMYRAFSLIVIIQYLLKYKKECTIVIDDLGEGLDFDRSSKLTKMLMKKLKDSNIQMLVTSNDRFLINSVDVECINLLERNGHIVNSYNYINSRKEFNEFKYTGLNNFDLFSTEMYKSTGEVESD